MRLSRLLLAAHLAVIASLAGACTSMVDPEEMADIEEDIGSSEGALSWCTRLDYALSHVPGSEPVYDSTLLGPVSALCLNHHVSATQGKDLISQGRATFPQYTGAFTTQRVNDCRAAYVRVRIYDGGASAAAVDLLEHAEVSIDTNGSLYPSDWEITGCEAHTGITRYYGRSTDTLRQSVIGWPLDPSSELTSRVHWEP